MLDNGALLGDDKSMPKDFLKTYNFFQDYGKEIEIDFSYDERAIPECTDQEASDFRTENR